MLLVRFKTYSTIHAISLGAGRPSACALPPARYTLLGAMRCLSLLCLAGALLTAAIAFTPPAFTVFDLKLRSRLEPFRGSNEWQEVSFTRNLDPKKTALILCDLWDNHWCKAAAERTGVLARKTAPVVDAARARGVLIIHAPSDTMAFYAETPQRKAALAFPAVEPPPALPLTDPPLPIDDSDGGCDTPNNPLPVHFRAWSRQHAAISIAPEDLITDNGREVYNALHARGIQTLLIMGVHTNMCVLNRSFAIRQMTRWGIRCILVRDLTDALYNPAMAPFVSHDAGTQLVIQHIEKHWAPTTTSVDLLTAWKGSR
jgi:nicotinamidase-related amidase